MKKRWGVTLLTGILLTGILCQNAYADEYSNEAENVSDYTYSILGDTVAITGYTGSDTEIVIPSEIDGLPVVAVSGFQNNTNLMAITLPSGLRSIGWNAFSGCINLESLTLPLTIENIEYHAFYGCERLKNVFIPGNLRSFDNHAFEACSNLSAITVDSANSNYCSIDGVLFTKDKKRLIIYPNGKVDSTYTIPASVEEIDVNAFEQVAYLRKIEVEKSNSNYCSVEGILFTKDKKSLIRCPSGFEQENYTIQSSVQYIQENAFRECDVIRSVTIPESVEYMGHYTFYGCNNLERVEIKDGLQWIGYYAFTGCTNLTSVTLPESIGQIAMSAFAECVSLKSIHLPDAVTDIGNSVFYDCKSLEEFHFPSSLRSLGSGVFSGCSSLKHIVLPANVNSTWFGMFKNCVRLEELELNDNVAWVSNEMFYGCSSLKTIVLPETCMGCTEGAFDGCTSLERLVCLSGDTNIIESGLQRLENKVIVYAPSGGMTEQTAKQIGLEFRDISKLPVKVTLVSQSGNITVTTTNDVLDSDTVLLAEQAAVSATDLIDQSAGNVRIYDLIHAAMYDIYLEKNGQKVQPNGEVTVSIPVPGTLDGQKCSVLYIDNSGKATDMNAVYKDGYMVFTTNHFSYYALVEEVKISLLGDVTGDGKVNTRDLNRLYAHVNGTNPLTGYEFACGDVTGDGKINTRDLNRLYAHISETNPLW